eukprot:72915-Chlamydomonas_euryale.AAC.1
MDKRAGVGHGQGSRGRPWKKQQEWKAGRRVCLVLPHRKKTEKNDSSVPRCRRELKMQRAGLQLDEASELLKERRPRGGANADADGGSGSDGDSSGSDTGGDGDGRATAVGAPRRTDPGGKWQSGSDDGSGNERCGGSRKAAPLPSRAAAAAASAANAAAAEAIADPEAAAAARRALMAAARAEAAR